jgi:hypothetical protein
MLQNTKKSILKGRYIDNERPLYFLLTSRFAQLPLPIAPISIICPGLSSPSHTKLPSLRYKSKSFSGLDTRSAPIDFVHFVFFDANP